MKRQGFDLNRGEHPQLEELEFPSSASSFGEVRSWTETHGFGLGYYLPQTPTNRQRIRAVGDADFPIESSDEYQAANDSCIEEANQAMHNAALLEELDRWEDVRLRQASDPRKASLWSEWSSCMANLGFEGFETATQTFNEAERRFGLLEGLIQLTADELRPSVSGEEVVTQRAEPGFVAATPIDAEIWAQVEEFQSWERTVAVAVLDCREPLEEDFKTIDNLIAKEYLDEG